MPNDLYDEEVAPSYISKDDIIKEYNDKILIHQTLISELEEYIAKECLRQDKANQKKIQKWQEDLEAKKAEIQRLELEKNEVDTIINTFYEKDNSKKWRLKNSYCERLDEKLLAHFKNGLLTAYTSSDVLIRQDKVVKILDQMRKIVWK
ncbi:hypothetical protein H1S01_11275 [Heliobacterium chlorum]|uniref:Uncharacterized protein n=1 Tax=Heliobacterium chlorum TaxID=2698 RepID=A0ABR7T2U0_HELCL|nr:hypothetical protein [Heliobacterium chlorum]MBC9785089.1 hypothetical protein [Heliobacterium chlorum]